MRRPSTQLCHASIVPQTRPKSPETSGRISTTEVFGIQKEDATFNYEGKRSLGSLLCTWAERRRVVAAQLRSGSASDKPISPAVVQRALRTLPKGYGEVRLRADSGFYSVTFLAWCRKHRLKFCVVVPRYRTIWEARRHIAPNSWRAAKEMVGAEVAEMPFVPTCWEGKPLRLLVRRVRVEAGEISQSPRSRRRKTIPQQQLRLALMGAVSHTYSYSFMVTDLPGDAVELEYWQRRRPHIEEQIKDLKLGCGLLHLPLRRRRANYAWQTAVVIASNLTAMLSAANVVRERQEAQAASGGTLSPEQLAVVGRPHNTAVLRRWLLTVPARVVRSGRKIYLRLAQGMLHKRDFWALHHHLLNLAPSG
ncbi:MAG: transposase, partial [Solirubrobacteraceae bacterium]